jgi:hypothetical protein
VWNIQPENLHFVGVKQFHAEMLSFLPDIGR